MTPTATLIQWNMGCRKDAGTAATQRCTLLQQMVEQFSPSVLALQEVPPTLIATGIKGYQLEAGPRALVTGYQTGAWIETGRDDVENQFVLELDHVSGRRKLTIWNVHLPVLWKTERNRREFIRNRLRSRLDSRRSLHPERAEIIVGDFNLCPHDEGILEESGFYANRSLEWVRGRTRRTETVRVPLYNPSWTLYGTGTEPSGTYYHGQIEVDGPWMIVDQVLMSAELAVGGSNQAAIIHEVAGQALWKARSELRCPNEDVCSDHFPVRTTFLLG